MATQEEVNEAYEAGMKFQHRAPSAGSRIVTAVFVAGFLVMIGIMVWTAYRQEQARATFAPPAQATASVPTKPLQQPVQPRNAAAPAIPGVAQNAATAQAMYEAAVEAAAPVPNVRGAPAPAVNVSIPSERQPAPDVVPTALPLPQGESGGIFGSKPAIVNPQQTHVCKHGQVWVDGRGCKNPTPER